MRFLLLCPLLAACATVPSEPPVAIPDLTFGFEPIAVIPTAAPDPDTTPPGKLVMQLQAHRPASTPTPLDTLLTAVLADDGEPFRGSSAMLAGWFLLAAAPTSPADATIAPLSVPVAADFVTRITPTAAATAMPELLLRRAGGRLQLALRATDGSGHLALFDDFEPTADGQLVLLRRAAGRSAGLAIIFRIEGPAAAGELAQARAAANAAAPPTTDTANPAVQLARDSVGADPRRRALLAVADRFDLRRGVDLLLCLDELQLIAVAEAMPPELESAYAAERAIWDGALPPLLRNEASNGLYACARRHLGALALAPTVFEFALATSGDLQQLEAAIEAGNRRALDARRVSSRCAAADWLTAAGYDLTGYDPHADRDARRAAIAQLGGSR